MLSMMGYYKISRHYKWALGQAFDHLSYDTIIIVEDDLDIGKFRKHDFVCPQCRRILLLRENPNGKAAIFDFLTKEDWGE